jgi:hypothetical protein
MKCGTVKVDAQTEVIEFSIHFDLARDTRAE